MKKIIIFISLLLLMFISGCKKKSYKISFYDGDKLIETIEYRERETFNLIDPIEKEGYTFDCWTLKDGSLISEGLKVSENIDLYAKFNIIKYTISYYVDDSLFDTKNIEYGSTAENLTPTKEGYIFEYWMLDDSRYLFDEVKSDLRLDAKFKSNGKNYNFTLSGNNVIEESSTVKINVVNADGADKPKINWSISDTSIADISQKSDTFVRIDPIKPGKVTITATTNDGLYSQTFELTIKGSSYTIEYVLSEEDKLLLPSDAPTSYNTSDLPLVLPVLEKEYFIFNGWIVSNFGLFTFDGTYTQINYGEIDGNIELKPSWLYIRLDTVVESSTGRSVIGIDEEALINVKYFNIPRELIEQGVNFEVKNSSILSVSAEGRVTGLKEGYTEINISLKANPKINITVGFTVTKAMNDLNDAVITIIKSINPVTIAKNAVAVGWQYSYNFDLLTSVSDYLFEDFATVENIAPTTCPVRPGTKAPKYYICVHDTGDIAFSAQQWSKTVYNASYDNGTAYEASFQYVVGNDGIYHNIPDDEVAWHAGDGSRAYGLNATGVRGTNKYPVTTISEDGYFELDGKKTKVLAPTYNGTILKTSSLGDYGVRVVIQDGEYYIGNTYYNTSYRKISNTGGNRNAIGIETCLNTGTDIFYTWQKTAKLVARLMRDNNLTVDDIVPHHFFSGKDCPQTIRKAGMWEYFKNMCAKEYDVLMVLDEGYKISFESLNKEYVNDLGRVIKWPTKNQNVEYTITISKGEYSESFTLSSIIPGSNN